MGSSFNPQILMEKLAKLNNSQASIETLSYWCIFHMNKAKQVVETWDTQFHICPCDQRLAFLYLANDILQNSRRKGSEFVAEFWKVLPGALRYVINNGDEFARNAAFRLINIWEERKVFGSRGQILKEELVGKHLESNNRDGKSLCSKLRQSAGNKLDKIVASYQVLYGGQLDEDVILSKCGDAMNFLEKADKEFDGDINSGNFNGPAYLEELQGQNDVLRDCIEKLNSMQSSRTNLLSYLREAVQEEEAKCDQVHNLCQAAQSRLEQANSIRRQLLNRNDGQLLHGKAEKDSHNTTAPHDYVNSNKEQPAPAMYSQVSFSDKSGHVDEDPRKSAAAAVAAKLTASTSSAQMLSYVLSSLASEGVIGNPSKDSSGDCSSEKRLKLDNDQSSYIPQNSQPPVLSYPLVESYQQNNAATVQQLSQTENPPLPSSTPPALPPVPPLPPYQLSQYMQTAGSVVNVPYNYGMTHQQSHPVPGYPTALPPVSVISPFTPPATNSYQNYQVSEGGLYNQPPSLPMAPISRQ